MRKAGVLWGSEQRDAARGLGDHSTVAAEATAADTAPQLDGGWRDPLDLSYSRRSLGSVIRGESEPEDAQRMVAELSWDRGPCPQGTVEMDTGEAAA